jgi:hypothetical protein
MDGTCGLCGTQSRLRNAVWMVRISSNINGIRLVDAIDVALSSDIRLRRPLSDDFNAQLSVPSTMTW